MIKVEKVSILAPMLEYAVENRDAAKVWPTYDGAMLDRRNYVSSSEIGKCAREIWFGKNLPLVAGKFKWGFAQRGHGHEAWIVEQLDSADHGYEFLYVGDRQVSFYDGHQSGTPDGVAASNGSNILLEFKSIDPRSKVSALPKDAHIKQTVQNMDIVEACLDMDFDGALLVYSNASDFSLTYEYWIDRALPSVGVMMDELAARAKSIMTATSADDVEPEGMYNGGCKTCVFGSQCSASITAKKMEKNRYDQISKHSTSVFG